MKIHTAHDLDMAIIELERRKVIQETILVEQFHDTVDHFRPKNLIKSAINKVLEPSDTRTTVLKAAGGIGLGMLTKSLLLGKSSSFLGKLAGNAIKMGAANGVLKHTDKIAAWGSAVYHNLFSKGKKTDA